MTGELRALRAAHALQRWHDAVVLVRTHHQRRRLAQGLAAAGIPCQARSSPAVGTPLSGTIMAWLALLRDGADSTALLRAVAAFPRPMPTATKVGASTPTPTKKR